MPRCARSASPCSRPTSTSRSSRTSSPACASEAIGQDVLQSLTAGQQVVKIVHDELVDLLGGGDRIFHLSGNPAVVAMVGLQGSGKTTIDRQARPPHHQAGPPPAPRRRRPVPARRRRPARDARQGSSTSPSTARRTAPRSPTSPAGRRGRQAPDPRRGHPRHRRPAQRRRGADGRDRRGQRGRQADRDAPRGRCHDRPGSGGRRPGVRGGGPRHRPHPDQDRWRRPRWRRTVASPPSPASRSSSSAPARRPTRSRCSIPTAWPAGSSAWATS